MFKELREGNENISALAFLAMTFVALYVIAGIVHPSLLGFSGAADADADADADAPAAAATARPNN